MKAKGENCSDFLNVSGSSGNRLHRKECLRLTKAGVVSTLMNTDEA
jgi:hypothetical protein